MAETKRIMLSYGGGGPRQFARCGLFVFDRLARRVRRSFCKPLEKVHAIAMLSGVNVAACRGGDFTDMRVR